MHKQYVNEQEFSIGNLLSVKCPSAVALLIPLHSFSLIPISCFFNTFSFYAQLISNLSFHDYSYEMDYRQFCDIKLIQWTWLAVTFISYQSELTDLWGGQTLLGQFEDLLFNIIGCQFEPLKDKN